MEIETSDAQDYLRKLGFGVEGTGDDFKVIAPSWRPDMVREDDVIEEIGRVHGYDKIPEELPIGHTTQGGVFGFDAFVDSLRQTVVRQGFVQTVSHSLMDAHPLDNPYGERLGPRNPNSPEMALLRNSILPNLADNAKRNGSHDLQLFEIGNVFGSIAGQALAANEFTLGYPSRSVYEVPTLGLFASGTTAHEHWEKEPAPKPSFFQLKAVIEESLRNATAKPVFESASDDSRFHPTRQSAILINKTIGVMGQIHPDKAEQLDLASETHLAELDLLKLYSFIGSEKPMVPVSRNPAVRRDIAILIDKSVAYSAIESAIAASCAPVLEKQWLFDVYEGKNIPEGKHSLAIAIQLRKFGENFTDEEANQVRDRAVAALVSLGATQR
jgi:phenylalanyl-tRNA synthetase beta chain